VAGATRPTTPIAANKKQTGDNQFVTRPLSIRHIAYAAATKPASTTGSPRRNRRGPPIHAPIATNWQARNAAAAATGISGADSGSRATVTSRAYLWFSGNYFFSTMSLFIGPSAPSN
jgi:hypothetical protein